MAEHAHVGSIEVIGELRGRLVQTSELLTRTGEECLSQATRILSWVQGPQMEHWKQQIRKREQKFASARSDLERAKIARPDADPRSFIDQQRALKRAKAAIEEAQAKLKAVKHWSRELDRQLTLLRGAIRPLMSAAEVDLPKAAKWLKNLTRHLEGYLEVAPTLPDVDAGDSETTQSLGRGGTARPAADQDDAS